jgi:hypothetical protein
MLIKLFPIIGDTEPFAAVHAAQGNGFSAELDL